VDSKEGQFSPASSTGSHSKSAADAEGFSLPDWVIWAALGAGVLLFLIFLVLLLKPSGGGVGKKEMAQQNDMIRQLQEMTENQAQQLQFQQEQARQMMTMQQQQLAQLQTSQQNDVLLGQGQAAVEQKQADLEQALADVNTLFDDDDDQLSEEDGQTMDLLAKPANGVKSWLETAR
jgi:hypothetical protein